ncbi:C40 family peptidase [Alkalibaculum sporogenes]|nr:C40 family peptidase [Alkalibaculum sporogenes]
MDHLKSYIGKINNRKVLIIYGVVTIIMTMALLIYQNTFSYQLHLNDELIGTISEMSIAEDALISIEEQISAEFGAEANYEFETTIKEVRVPKDQIIDQEELENLIYDNLQIYKPAAVIFLDGKEILALETKEQAESILNHIKEPFVEKIDQIKGNVEVLDISFNQDIEIAMKDVPIEEIFSTEKALNEIEKSKEQVQTYEIASGDNAWNVSRSFNTAVNKLQEANPDKSLEDLMPGDKINLVVEKPYIDVTATVKQITQEAIAFETENENSSSLYTGETKVKQEGKKGEKEITKEITYLNGAIDSQKVIDEKVITKPTKKIVLVGTKSRPVVARSKSVSTSRSSAPTYKGNVGSAIVSTARHYIGVPYVSGGSSPSGFDCSGFTQYVYRQYGISLPRTSGGQGSVGGFVARSDLKPGDLVVFSGHVGIYVGNNSFIHAPTHGKRVQITSLNSAYWRSKYISGRRVY